MNVISDQRTTISDTVLTVWAINSRLNTALLDYLRPEMLGARVSGGWAVGQHIQHMMDAKTYWTGLLDADAMRILPALFDEPDTPSEAIDLERLRKVTLLNEKAVLDTVRQAVHVQNFPYETLDVFLLHLTHHDAHHRALILLALRHCGHDVPDAGTMWSPWRIESGKGHA